MSNGQEAADGCKVDLIVRLPSDSGGRRRPRAPLAGLAPPVRCVPSRAARRRSAHTASFALPPAAAAASRTVSKSARPSSPSMPRESVPSRSNATSSRSVPCTHHCTTSTRNGRHRLAGCAFGAPSDHRSARWSDRSVTDRSPTWRQADRHGVRPSRRQRFWCPPSVSVPGHGTPSWALGPCFCSPMAGTPSPIFESPKKPVSGGRPSTGTGRRSKIFSLMCSWIARHRSSPMSPPVTCAAISSRPSRVFVDPLQSSKLGEVLVAAIDRSPSDPRIQAVHDAMTAISRRPVWDVARAAIEQGHLDPTLTEGIVAAHTIGPILYARLFDRQEISDDDIECTIDAFPPPSPPEPASDTAHGPGRADRRPAVRPRRCTASYPRRAVLSELDLPTRTR